jgi:hypothetical protein
MQKYKLNFAICSVCGCGIWPLTLSEKHKLRVSENSVLRKISGPEVEEGAGGWSKLHKGNLYNFTNCQIFFMLQSQRGLDGRGVWLVWGITEMRTGF